MQILTKLLLILLSIQLSPCLNINRVFKINCYFCYIQYDKVNIHENTEVYPWLVAINNKQNYNYRYGHGSLILPNVVLTLGTTIYGYEEEELIVEAMNYQTKFATEKIKSDYKRGIIRNVVRIVYQASYDNNRKYQNYFAVLMLENPYHYVNTINIAENVNAINKDNCFMTYWKQEETMNDVIETDLVPALYKASFLLGSSYDNRLNSNITGNDIPENICFDTQIDQSLKRDGYFFNRLILKEVLGNPIVCQLKEDPKKYAQIGISITLQSTSDTYILDDMENKDGKIASKTGYFINIIGHTYYQ